MEYTVIDNLYTVILAIVTIYIFRYFINDSVIIM